MIKIGITGGIGSGKTTVCKLLELLGVPVFYADAAAREVMQSDEILKTELIAVFGTESYFPSGELNRKYIAGIVFNDAEELQKLNSLVHPAVFRAFDRWAAVQNAPYVAKEAALLFESNSYQDCNYTILVKAPLELKISRVMQRDNITADEVLKRVEKQWSDDKRESLCDFILNNNEQQFLIPEVLKLHKHFLSEAIK